MVLSKKCEGMGNIMLENIWRYSLYNGRQGGIVIAFSREEAKQKVTEMYEDWYGKLEEKDNLRVWKVIVDDDYRKDYPDILEIY